MSNLKPENVSSIAWDKARNFLSEGFIYAIGSRIYEVVDLSTYIHNLESYGYKMETWQVFQATPDLPEGLFERAKQWHEDGGFDFVIYDPEDDENGMMLVGNNATKLAKEFCEYIADKEPNEGPLSKDALAMAAVENGATV